MFLHNVFKRLRTGKRFYGFCILQVYQLMKKNQGFFRQPFSISCLLRLLPFSAIRG
jgi:hypothetical protein